VFSPSEIIGGDYHFLVTKMDAFVANHSPEALWSAFDR